MAEAKELNVDVRELTLDDLCDLELMQNPKKFSPLAVRRILFNTCPEDQHESIGRLRFVELDSALEQLVEAMAQYREESVSKKTEGD